MESFGAQLMQERERRHITLQQISRSTKIHIRFLIAIEQEQFDHLPGGVISKGFLRAYAQEIGIDAEQVIYEYEGIVGPDPPLELSEGIHGPLREPNKPGGAARLPWWSFVAALLAISVGFLALQHYQREQEHENASAASTPGKEIATHSQDPATSGSQESTVQKPTPIDPRDSEIAAPETSDDQPAPVRGSTISQPMLGNAMDVSGAPGTFSVSINARQDAWLSISADGKRIMQNTLIAPAETAVVAYQHIVIRAGNVGALDFMFNGHPLPAQGDYGEAKTLNFDGNGLESQVVRPSSPSADVSDQ